MRLGGKRNRVMLCSILIIFMFTVFSPNVQFQISTVHAGDWETIEYIDSIEDLNTEPLIEVEGELVHQGFVPAASVTYYVDATQSQTHGTTTPDPPSGMGVNDAAHSTLQEESYLHTSYSTKTSYTGGTLPSGWGNTDWSFGAIYVNIWGVDKTGGNFYTNSHDMTSYAGVRVKFDWRNDGSRTTELGDLECNSYEGGNNVWFESPVGNQGSFTNELRDSSWHSTAWKVKFTASGLDGDIDTWEGFRVDNIYLQGKVSNTYYRFEAVYRFDSITYTYGAERLYVDYDSGTSTEGLNYYGGITTDPSSFIGSTSGVEPDTDFDIHDELTGTPFYVKIVDNDQTEGDQDSWLIDRLYITITNEDPTISSPAVITNLDEGDNLYARKRWYELNVTASDANGYADIFLVEVYVYESDDTYLYYFAFNENGNTFFEGASGHPEYIELDTSGSSYSKSGNDVVLTFRLKINWTHPDLTNTKWRSRVYDSVGSGLGNENQGYDIETRLSYYMIPAISDGSGTADRGDLDQSFTMIGRVKYYETADLAPAVGEVNVWVSCPQYGTNYGPWSDLVGSESGIFAVTCYADDVVGIDTYTFKPVGDDTGSGGASLYYTTDRTDTYISDSLTITITGPTDNRQNINANASGIGMSAVYDYGGAFDGTLTMNNTDYNGDGTVVRWGYTVSSASGDTHGVTTISTNDETYMIWDQIEVYYGAVSDPRTNIDEQEYPYFRLRLKYDNHLLNDGTNDVVYINGSTTATWSAGDSAWYKYYTQVSVGSWNFVVTSASEDTYGITAFDSASAVTYDQDIIWDSLTITITGPTDNRINIGANASGIGISAVYDYGGTFDGTFILNDTTYDHGVMGIYYYTVLSVSGDTHGITYINVNDDTYCIFDSLTVSITNPTDQRININANASGMHMSAIWDYDSETYDGTLTLNDTTYDHGSVGIYYYTVTVGNGDDTYGITAVSSSDSVYCIFDRIKILTTVVYDARINYGTQAIISVTAQLEYTSGGVHSLGSGDTLYMNDTGMSWNGSHFILNPQFNIVDIWNFFVNSTSANEATYGITIINLDGNSVNVIWDRIYAVSLSYGGDTRINVGTSVNFDYELHYDYDEADVADGTIFINSIEFSYQSGGIWRYTTSNGGAVGDITFDSIVAASNTYGITSTTTNSNDVTLIWDRIYVVSLSYTGSPDTRINIGTSINFDWELHYDYDEADVTDGTVTINGYACAYQGSGVWRYTNSSGSVGDLTLDDIQTTGNTHGITEEYQNGKTVEMIWDRIQVQSYSVSDARDDVNDNVDIDATLWYDYDDASVTDGTVTINGYSASYQGSGVWRITRTSASITSVTYNNVQATGNTHGITTEDQNGQSQEVIWDKVIWNMYMRNATTVARSALANCTSVNIGETVNITARFLFEHDSTAVTNGTILLEGESMTHIANGYWYLLVSNVTAQFGDSYQWNSFATTGNDYGITVENANSKDFHIIWDSIYISYYSISPDARHNLGEYPTISVTAKLTYDNHILNTVSDYVKIADQTFQWDGTYLQNNTFTLNQVGQFTLATNDTGHYEATYGITEIEYYSFTTIFDRVFIYAMWSPTEADNRTNYGDTETVYVSFVSEHDNSSMTAGTFELNSTGMSYVSDSNWQKTGYAYSEVANYTFDVTSATWSTYNINQINYNDWNVTYYHIVWDRVKILTTATDDGRITYDTNATLSVTAELEYDSHSLGSGDTLYLNNTAMSWNGSHFVLLDQKFASVGIWNYYVNTSGINEASYGITYLNLNGQSVNQIWDRVYLTGIYVSDSRASYGTDVNVTVTAKAEYDDATLGSGDNIYVNGTLATWDSTNSVFNVTYSYSEVVNKTFHVTATTEATYDITVFTNDTYIWIIWDRLKITGFLVDNVIPDPLQMIFVNLTMVYEFDDAEFHFDNGTITMIAYNVTWDVEEEKNMHWNDTNWQFNHTMPSGVGVIRNFNISAFTDSVYAIVVINWNGFDNVTAGSDRVLVVSYTVSDDRDNINDYIWVNVTLQLESNNTAITDGDVVINGYIFTHISDGLWKYNTTSVFVFSITFDTVVAENNTYGIETVNQNGQYTTVIWDAIGINMWISDGRDDVDGTITIYAWLTYMYDRTNVTDGTVLLNGTGMSYGDSIWSLGRSQSTAGLWTYNITSISGNTHGITVIGSVYSVQADPSDITVSGGLDGLGNSTGGTFSFWLYVDWDSVGYADTLMAQGSDWDHGILIISTANSILELDLRYTDGTDDRYNMRVNLSAYSNTWVHVSYVFDGDAQLIYAYVNGVAAAEIYGSYSEAASKPILPDVEGDDFALFVCSWAANPFYDGQVNDVRVYNRSLLASEIFEIYQGRYADNTGLLLHWSTSSIDVVDNIWYDLSDEENDGTLCVITVNATIGELYVKPIWDQFVLTRFNSSDADGRTNLDETEYIHFGMKWDYDDAVFQSGNGTIYLNSTLLTWNASQSCWSMSWVNSTPVSYVFAYASHIDSVYGITAMSWGAYDNVTQTWDRIGVTVATNMTWTIVGYNVMISYTLVYESDGVTWDGYTTVANTSMVSGSGPRNENLTFTTIVNKTFYTTAISEDSNGVIGFTTTTVWCVWDNVTAVAMYGVEITEGSKTFTISFKELQWQYNSSGIGADWICNHIRNGTVVSSATTGEDDLLSPLEQEIPIDPDWDAILYSNNATKTIDGRSYDFQWYSVTQIIVATQDIKEEDTQVLDITIVISGITNVDFTWTIYNEDVASGETGTVSDADDWRITFNMIMTYGNHSYAIYCDASASGNRWINNSYFILFDVNIDPPEIRGVNVEVRGTINIDCSYYVYHEDSYSDETGSLTPTTFSFFFTKMTGAGLHNYSLHFNISSTVNTWKNGSYYVSADIYDCHIVILDSLYQLIPFDTFEVYINDTRIYHDIIRVTEGNAYNVTVKNRHGDAVNDTAIFDAAREMVVFVNVFSLKFWSAYEGFCTLTVSRGGVDYTEVLMPMEIVNFRLYSENYTYSIDYLDDTVVSGDINLLASTGIIVTNDTISDVFDLIDSVWDMMDDINITVNTVADNTYTIQLMFDWTNTTLYNQSITILASFNWENTTLYNQTISLLSAFNATNTVLYNQVVLIQNMFNWDNTTLYNQTISILNAFNATNTVIYEQTVSMLSNISSMNSTIYSQTVDVLTNVGNVNSTLYAQTLNILTNITNVNSTIYSQTVSVLSSISNVNTTLYAQTLNILSNITNINSTIYSQTVNVISYIWNNANSIYNQTLDILSDVQNTNTTIYTQTVSILSNITNLNSTIYSQTVDILNHIWNNAASIYNQTVTMLSDISNVNTTLYSQTVTLLSNIENVNSTIYTQTLSILSDISNMNTTLYSQTVTLLSNIENVNSTVYTQTLTILSDISNVNTTLYDQTVTVLSNIQNINTTLYQQTIDILTNITNVNSTIYSQVLSVVNNLAELNATIYLVDDPTNLNFLIAGHSFSDDYCDLTIVSSWHNATLTIYENGVSKVGPVSELNCPIRYTLNETIGSYNLSVYVDAGVDSLWYNISYVVEGMAYGQINIYNSRGTGFDDTYFIVYINGSRYFDNRFYNRTDYIYNVTVTDYFGYVILQNTYDWARMIDVGIDFYVYKIKSEVQGQAIYFNLTRTGGAKFSQHLLSGEILFYYLAAGEYTYEFRKIAVNTMAGGTYVYYEGTFTLSCDKTHIIDGTNLRDLEGSIERIPVSKANVKPLGDAMSGIIDMISVMQLGMWGLAFLIVGGMAATAIDEEVIIKDGKKVKKRKIPKQLKRFAFKRGAKNPKSKKIPKGAGRSSWKGVPFRDEIKDWRKDA